MTQPILIAQISDLHIKAPGQLAYGVVDTSAALSRCIVELNRLDPRPDLVVISGDVADTPTADEYEQAVNLLSALDLPYVAIPGNHDDRALMRSALGDETDAAPQGPLNQLHRVGDLDIVLLDSSVPGAPHGELDAETLAWLDATLAATPERPALLFLHHPPFITGIGHMDVQNLRNAPTLAELIARHNRARMIAAGHVHRATMASFAGIAATICPAPNHAVALDLAGRMPPAFRIEPPAFHLHRWFADGKFGQVVTHLVPIGDFDGPHPFFSADGRLL
ncbi:MAG: phosphodiesterase [Rhodopseudomonas sp.]|nr:phosphodiesterase [Rhodopseudomonas sp.]